MSFVSVTCLFVVVMIWFWFDALLGGAYCYFSCVCFIGFCLVLMILVVLVVCLFALGSVFY